MDWLYPVISKKISINDVGILRIPIDKIKIKMFSNKYLLEEASVVSDWQKNKNKFISIKFGRISHHFCYDHRVSDASPHQLPAFLKLFVDSRFIQRILHFKPLSTPHG